MERERASITAYFERRQNRRMSETPIRAVMRPEFRLMPASTENNAPTLFSFGDPTFQM
jgi:hypothetical protein